MNNIINSRRIRRALLATMSAMLFAGAAQAAFIITPFETTGAGLGTVNTVLTFSRTPTESGCVSRGAGVDVVGPAACLGANVGGDEGTGASQTQTRSLGELGLTSADNLRAVFNSSQSAGGPIQLDSLVLGIYSDTGTLLFTSSTFAPILFPITFSGTGTSGYVFRLDPADAAAAQPFFANPTNRIGISASASMTSGGPETIFIADVAGVAPSAVDIALTKTDSADPATVNSSLAYTITARNNGPNTATNVVITDTLPASVDFVSFSTTQGSCMRSGSVITCNLGTIGVGQVVTVQIVVTPRTPGTITNSVTGTSTEVDTNPANNTATQPTLILGAAPTAVPTFSGWALLLLGLLVTVLGAGVMRMRA